MEPVVVAAAPGATAIMVTVVTADWGPDIIYETVPVIAWRLSPNGLNDPYMAEPVTAVDPAGSFFLIRLTGGGFHCPAHGRSYADLAEVEVAIMEMAEREEEETVRRAREAGRDR
jgi:hypothetical protein